MRLKSKASLQILKPVEVVYDAIVNDSKIINYFISESTGPLQEGVDVKWKFPEFDEQFPITSVRLVENEKVSFVWDPETVVTITLKAYNNSSTIVQVEEDGKDLNEENLNWLISNVAGWSNFLSSMKAYIEYGINLRKGAYEFMKDMH